MTDSLINSLPISIISIEPDGSISYANPAAERLLGLVRQPDETGRPGRIVWKTRARERRKLLEALCLRFLNRKKNGQPHDPAEEYEFEWLDEAGGPIVLALQAQGKSDPTGRGAGLVAAIRDITGQRQAEVKVRESESFYRTLFEHGGFGIALVDPDTGRRIAFNRKLHERLGYTREEYEQLTVADIQFDYDPERTLERGRRALREGAVTFEEKQRTKDGKACYVLVSAVPVTIGGRVLVHAISLDVTEKRRLESELLQAQKMEAIGRLAGGVAHDFNNMLSVILGYAELALNQLSPAAQLFHEITEIKKAASRSADLTRQLLAFSRKQIIAPQAVNINHIISDQYAMLSRLIGEDIGMQVVPDGSLWNVRIDPVQVNQILTNLAANARDAIKGVGTVTIRTANVTVPSADSRLDLIEGDYVQLSFSDTGSGIDPAIMEHIFEPFYTTKPEGQGSGLGLATVYGIAKQNNGVVQVLSEVEKGTTINIYFPRHVGGGREVIKAEAGQVSAPARSGETILVVEDDPQLLELTTKVLKRHGYHILGCDHPAQAIAVCREFTGAIQLLITDVIMPEMNGKELQLQIRQIRPEIKTLFVSGYSAEIISARGVLEQGVDFISKPYSVSDLALKARQVMDR